MKLIDLLSHPALQGLEALVAILLALTPLAVWTIRKVRRSGAAAGSREEAVRPRIESAPPAPGPEAGERLTGCLGLVAGYFLLIPVATSFTVITMVFLELGSGSGRVKSVWNDFLENTPQLNEAALFPFQTLAQLLLGAILVTTLAIFFRGRFLRGVRFFIVAMAAGLCLLSLPFGLFLQAPPLLVAVFDAAVVLSACTVWGAAWLVRYAWQHG